MTALVAGLILAWTAGTAVRPAAAASPPAQAPAPGVTARAAPPAGVTTVPDGTAGKVAGMAIPNVNPQQSDAEVSRLHALDGLNTVALFVWWWMPQADSNFVERCTNPTQGDQQGCNPTEPDAALQLQIAAARNNGMRVMLVPIFYCGTCEGGWRGTAQPSDPSAWFGSYRSFIDHYADLARQNDVNTLFIGSEMDSLESQTSQWQQVISSARSHFGGQVAYEENWDVLGKAHFLDSVDLVSVSAYFPLDDGRSPSLRSLLADWSNSHTSAYQGRNWVAALGNLARSTGKPILFGEIGYMGGDYAGKQPFLNYASTINWQLQSDLYQAALETFQNQSWWAGAVWWEWYIPTNSNTDDGRTPRDKTAETLMQRWYRDGWRPASPTTPLVLSDAQHSPDNPELAPPPVSAPTGGTAPGANGAPSRPGATNPAAAGTPAAAGRPPASGGTARPGAVAGRVAAAGQPGAAAAAAPGSPSSSHRSGPLTGTGKTLAVVAIVALAVLVLMVVIYNGSRYADSRRPPPRPHAG